MKGILLILIIIGLLLLISGCSEFVSPQITNGTGTQKNISGTSSSSGSKYAIGDVAIQNPGDMIGEVVQNFDPVSSKYSTRSVIFDEFGNLFYYEGGGTKSFSTTDFEAKYPYKRAHIDNPYGLQTMKKEHTAKYSVNQVVTKKDAPLEGIKILSYDYQKDAYTYTYVFKQGAAWENVSNTIYEGARTDVEERFQEKKTNN
ncbi:MAG: hypothetical protein ABFC78_11060 [Methanoregula sp.]